MGTTKGFTGQYNDSLSGLDYYNARYYDPVVGRFLSADSLQGNGAGMDPYAYVGNNPETNSDPSGQFYPPGDSPPPPPLKDKPIPHTDVKLAAYIGQETSRALGHNNCPSGQQTSDCFATRLQQITEQVVAGKVTVNSGLGPGRPGPCVAAFGGIGGCVLLPGGGPGTQVTVIARSISITPVDFCPQPAACAAGEAGGEGAKGEEESYDLGIGGRCSFTPTTLVTTDHGKQAISTLQVGERVLAYNPKTGKMEQEPILHVWINHDTDLVNLTITTMMQGQQGKASTKTSEVVHTNQKHPFLTIEQGFLPVGKIKLGMHLLRADGHVGVVTGWKVVPGTQVMYNLEVAQDHTFTVGAGQWVVHNCNDLNQQAAIEAVQLFESLGLGPVAEDRTTVAVAYVEDQEGGISRLVSMNSEAMRGTRVARLQSLLSPGEWVGSAGRRLHAEQNLLRYIDSNGLKLRGIGASRFICEMCSSEITSAWGADVIGTPTRAGWAPDWVWVL